MDTGQINLLWGRAVVAQLVASGVRHAVISPGSRSTPLVLALAENETMEAIPVLDERSAGFLALGLAKATGVPVALVCTSGSAVANLLPAVVEARMAGVPILILTADRPPELQDCHAGQTIDQQEIFGRHARMFAQAGVPSEEGLPGVRKLLAEAFQESLCADGPVHLNFPFREPLLPEGEIIPVPGQEVKQGNEPSFVMSTAELAKTPDLECPFRRVLVIAGAGGPGLVNDWGQVVLALARKQGWPVLADPLSGLRDCAGEGGDLVIAHYDSILRDDTMADSLRPEAVLQVGTLPTSKVLRQRLQEWDAPGWVVSPLGENFDPLHSSRKPLESLPTTLGTTVGVDEGYAHGWMEADAAVAKHFQNILKDCGDWFEGKASWMLNRHLPEGTAIHVASSMPIRDVESFWGRDNLKRRLSANRGANGIDGTLSTALGIAQARDIACLLTGDLAFLHDRNGLLLAGNPQFSGRLTVVLVNNNGGGIFEGLAIAGMNPPFEEFFATPQHIDFQKLSEAHGIPHHRPVDWDDFAELISRVEEVPVRVIEVCTDRKKDSALRREILKLSKT